MRQRLRQEDGFGLMELLLAITMLNVGILAIVAAFNAGALALGRASKTSTATAIADTQMELFRGIKYANIVQTNAEWASALGDNTWTADTIYQQNMASPQSPKALVPTVANCPVANTNACDPSFLQTGPDGRSYRVDTYLYFDAPKDSSGTVVGSQIKVIGVVVRDANDVSHSLARATSTFDLSTGS